MKLTSFDRLCLTAGIVISLVAGCATSPGNDPSVHADLAYSGDFDRPPEIKSMPRTEYPRLLRERGATGAAVVTFTVNVRGRVENSRVTSASETAFGGAAISTVGPMEFHPATRNGKPVPASGTATFTFGAVP